MYANRIPGLFFRYNNLSRDSQLKLLNYVRNNIGIECSNDAIKNNNIITDDNVIINNNIDKLSDEKRGYCRKRGK